MFKRIHYIGSIEVYHYSKYILSTYVGQTRDHLGPEMMRFCHLDFKHGKNWSWKKMKRCYTPVKCWTVCNTNKRRENDQKVVTKLIKQQESTVQYILLFVCVLL